MRIKADIYHHTHWDNEWYFTEEDSLVQLTYHMKELIQALEEGVIDYFFLDGQTAILEDYLELHKEDQERVRKLLEEKKLFAGPFHTQIDSFITSGESIINNLRCGIRTAEQYGGASKIAYLPDSFGQTQDYPKIFQGLGIDSFVFRRGMGDEHGLPLDFIYASNDGSSVIATTLNCGYGFATEPFIHRCLTKDAGLDYDGKDIASQLKKLAELSTLDDEFLLPIGNDQTPVIWNFKELLASYQDDETYEFTEITLANYMEKLKRNEKKLKTYTGEFINPQYHRVHRSIYSARMDTKILQDRLERMMALEIQPMMTMLNDLGLPYDHQLINRIWNMLGRSQTHSGATNTDKTNDLIMKRTEKAYNIAEALKVYLIRKVAISLSKESLPIVFFNTLPNERTMNMKLDIYTREKDFSLRYQGRELSYTKQEQERIYGGVARKYPEQLKEENYFYKTTVALRIDHVAPFSYHTIYVDEKGNVSCKVPETVSFIENEYYRIQKGTGKSDGFTLILKSSGKEIKDFISLEESGDEGDNYDYSYPSEDMIVTSNFHDANYTFHQSEERSILTIEGTFACPKDLKARVQRSLNNTDTYRFTIELKAGSPTIGISGNYDNHAENHRVRLVAASPYASLSSTAGTQFGSIDRENIPAIMSKWKEEGWLEEPSPIYPLLNYVMIKENVQAFVLFTKSSKEYEMIGENFEKIAVTIFRSVGHLGLPDLNRRPGRASGIAEKIISSPHSQMIGRNEIEIGLLFTEQIDRNDIVNKYNEFAVSECYYQNQNFNRVVYPISYFQTNPMMNKIPDTYEFQTDKEWTQFAFSTLEMIGEEKIIRLFHNEEAMESHGVLKKVDLLGNHCELSSHIRTGEILNLVIEHEAGK